MFNKLPLFQQQLQYAQQQQVEQQQKMELLGSQKTIQQRSQVKNHHVKPLQQQHKILNSDVKVYNNVLDVESEEIRSQRIVEAEVPAGGGILTTVDNEAESAGLPAGGPTAGTLALGTAKRSVAFEQGRGSAGVQTSAKKTIESDCGQLKAGDRCGQMQDGDEDEEDEVLVSRGRSLMMLGIMDKVQNATDNMNTMETNLEHFNTKHNRKGNSPSDYVDLSNIRDEIINRQMQDQLDYQSLIQTKGIQTSQVSQTPMVASSFDSFVYQLPKLVNNNGGTLIAMSQDNLPQHALFIERDIFNVPQTTGEESFEFQRQQSSSFSVKKNVSTGGDDDLQSYLHHQYTGELDKVFVHPEINQVTKHSSHQSQHSSTNQNTIDDNIFKKTDAESQRPQQHLRFQGEYVYCGGKILPSSNQRNSGNSAVAAYSLSSKKRQFKECNLNQRIMVPGQVQTFASSSPGPKVISLQLHTKSQHSTAAEHQPSVETSAAIHQSFKPSRVIQNPTLLLNHKVSAQKDS